MAVANMTYNYFAEKDEYKNDIPKASQENIKYFHLEKEIVPFFEDNWESLTNIPRRVKNSWHQTLHKTLAKETELFATNPENELEFALNERNLLDIGPLLESIRKVRDFCRLILEILDRLTLCYITNIIHFCLFFLGWSTRSGIATNSSCG